MARGFTLLCLGLDVARPANTAGDDVDGRFQRFERLLVAGQVKHHGSNTPFAGKRAALAYLELPKYPVRRGPILSQQLSSGLWGTYRTACAYFGLVESIERSRRSSPQFTRLTAAGKSLATQTRSVAFDPSMQIGKWIEQEEISHDVLDRVSGKGHSATKAEVSLLSDAVRQVDEADSSPLAMLRSKWGASSPLTLSSLSSGLPEGASGEQKAALASALALDRLASLIEAGYRQWVTDQQAPHLQSGIWRHPDWADALSYRSDLSHLVERLRSAKSGAEYEQLHAHQQWLSEVRGGRPWDRTSDELNAQTRGTYAPYDFALPAVNDLFAEGLLR